LRKSGAFADLEAIDLGPHDQRGKNRTNGTEGDRVNIPTANGVYFSNGEYIALRDNSDTKWRLSRITANPDTSLTLTLIGVFDHQWEVMERIR